MYAILNKDKTIGDFEMRDLPLDQLVCEAFRSNYIHITDEEFQTLKIGDIWVEDLQKWNPVEKVEINAPALCLQPTTTDIAQLISDLYADLVIAGVI